jgi:hypothetical protein
MASLGDRALLLRVITAGAILVSLITGLVAGDACAVPASDLFIRQTQDSLEIRWSLPAEAALEPALVKEMRAEADRQVAELQRDATEAAGFAHADDRFVHQWFWYAQWRLGALSQALLAIQAAIAIDTGGAHHNVSQQAVIYDRKAGRRISAADLFRDWKAAEPLLRREICSQLERQRNDRLGTDRKPSPIPAFDECPKTDELAIWPSGEDSRPWGLRWAAAPYVAGTWAEGSYGDFVSLGPELTALLKPAYREDFLLPERFR